MIRFVRGVPGSGKSYYAVNYLMRFCTYDKLYESYTVKDNCLIITNIDNLNINHLNLDKCIEKYTFEKFFSVENFEKIRDIYRVHTIVLIIDEAQRYFPMGFKQAEVLFFFQYHRHLGVDVILLSQTVKTVTFALVALAEYIIEAKPRSKGIPLYFRYAFYDIKDNYLYSEQVRKKDEVFRAYQSFKFDEVTKPKNVYKIYLISFVILIFVIFLVFKYIVIGTFSVESSTPDNNTSAVVTPTTADNKLPLLKSSATDDLSRQLSLVEVLADSIFRVTTDGEINYYSVISGVRSNLCRVRDLEMSIVSCPQFELDRIDRLTARRGAGATASAVGQEVAR